jgi:signal transduction histidine kinase/CheY-like chemotaxis protein
MDYEVGLQWFIIAVASVGIVVSLVAYFHQERRMELERLTAFEERLRESEERLRQAQKMEAVGQLAGGIAHDFNNLITVIGCSVGLLTDATEAKDPRREDLGQIKEAVDRAAALTRQLLAFSRRQVLQPRPLDLNEVVRDMEKMMRRVIGSHIAIHTTLEPKLSYMLADVGQIEQVVMNLAVNARDAMPTSGALLFATENRSVRLPEPHRHGVIEPGDYVTLTVRDSGQGMPASVLDHLFEPFFTTKEQGHGTGLGLATVHGIVYQSGGHITVSSTLGVGTTFTLYFPKIHSGDRQPTQAAGIRIVASDNERRRSVLVVDDQDAIRDISERVLQQAGFRVLTAKHGEEALEMLDQRRNAGDPISLVLTDVVMPVMGGRELANIVLKDYQESRVLCISGYSRDELVRQRLVDDSVRLIHKPFEAGELVEAVRDTLGAGAVS